MFCKATDSNRNQFWLMLMGSNDDPYVPGPIMMKHACDIFESNRSVPGLATYRLGQSRHRTARVSNKMKEFCRFIDDTVHAEGIQGGPFGVEGAETLV